MFKKRLISDDPLTYKFFEQVPKLPPLYLGQITHVRDTAEGLPWFRWESAFGACSGEGPDDVAINAIQTAAMKSMAVQDMKIKGRYMT